MKAPLRKLADLATIPRSPINPQKYPDENFLLFSLPAYDRGDAEIAAGRTIKSSKTAIKKGDVLVSKLNPRIPRIWFVDHESRERAICSTEFIPFRAIDKDRLNGEYLTYMLLSPQVIGELAKQVRSSTGSHQRVRPSDICTKKIPLPTLHEQLQIVARIKECMERVEEIEKLRAEAEADRNSLLQALIDAELERAKGGRCALADVCSIQSALIDPTGKQFLESIHVGGANIESGTGVFLNLQTSREEKLKSSKFPFNSSMVLYNKIRPYLRKVARPDFEGICSADMYPLLPDKRKLLKDYLFYILLSGDFTRYAIQGSNRAGMPKVNREHLFKYEFTLPSIDQQKVICTKLDQAFSAFLSIRQELSMQEQSEKLLRDAILGKAFSGEL